MRRHTTIFKCIGATRDSSAQEALHKVSELMKRGELVHVELHCQPDNLYDEIGSRLVTLIRKLICFSWVKYIVTWTQSGFYAGISVTLGNGIQMSVNVQAHANIK